MNKELLNLPHEFQKDENGITKMKLVIKATSRVSVVISPEQMSSLRPIYLNGKHCRRKDNSNHHQ